MKWFGGVKAGSTTNYGMKRRVKRLFGVAWSGFESEVVADGAPPFSARPPSQACLFCVCGLDEDQDGSHNKRHRSQSSYQGQNKENVQLLCALVNIIFGRYGIQASQDLYACVTCNKTWSCVRSIIIEYSYKNSRSSLLLRYTTKNA